MAASTLPHVSWLIVAAVAALAVDRGCERISSPGTEPRDAECNLDEDCTLPSCDGPACECEMHASCIAGTCQAIAPVACS